MKDPAVLFYTQDFLTGTFTMTDAQVGKYIRLLCLQQQNGGLCEKEMMKVCGEKDDDIWAKFNFENGRYFNKRMMLETNKRRKFTESRIANLSHMDSHMENRNKKIEISNKKEEEENVFKSEVFEFSEKYSEAMLNNFCAYWTEMNKSKTKMRFELQKCFDISRRLATWAIRDKDYNKVIPKDQVITHATILNMFNKGETDVWGKYEKAGIINGKVTYKLKQ
jgi:hypothetical protein